MMATSANLNFFNVIGAAVSAAIISSPISSNKNTRKTEIKKAEKKFGSKELSGRIETECTRLSCNNLGAELLYSAAAKESNKWVNLALYYITNLEAKLPKAGQDEKALMNGVASYIGYGKIYRESAIADITKYDAKNLDLGAHPKFIISIDDLDDIIMNPEFDAAWKQVLAERGTITVSNPTSLPTPIHEEVNSPIFSIDNDALTIDTKKNRGIDDKDYELYEAAFAPLLANYEYYYDIDSVNNTYLCIDRGGMMESRYLIDNGSIMGGSSVTILGYYQLPEGKVDGVFINVNKHSNLVKTMLETPVYVFGPEIQEVFLDYFNDSRIYHNIDFSNTGWMDELNKDQKYILEKSLRAVYKVLDDDVRLKFESYNAPDDFVLTSEGAKSPMMFDGTTAPLTDKLVRIAVKHKKMVKRFGSNTAVDYNLVYEQ